MICERCQKEHAKVYLNKVIDGKKQEIHLCRKCALEVKGYLDEEISFQSFLSGLLGINKKIVNENIYNREDILICNKCNMAYSEFQKRGKFGCSNCYEAFSEVLTPVIKRVHGSNIHTGKIPNRASEKIKIERQIEELQNELQIAVNNEEYEQAAKFRDEIRALKKEGGIC